MIRRHRKRPNSQIVRKSVLTSEERGHVIHLLPRRAVDDCGTSEMTTQMLVLVHQRSQVFAHIRRRAHRQDQVLSESSPFTILPRYSNIPCTKRRRFQKLTSWVEQMPVGRSTVTNKQPVKSGAYHSCIGNPKRISDILSNRRSRCGRECHHGNARQDGADLQTRTRISTSSSKGPPT